MHNVNIQVFTSAGTPGVQPANEINDFMDYSITEFWWNGTPGLDQTDQITPQYSFLTTPIGWIMNADYTSYFPRKTSTSTVDLKTFFLFPNTTWPSYPFDIQNYTLVTPSGPGPSRPQPWHIQYPGLTPPPNFPSDYKYPAMYPNTERSTYIPSPTGPTPKKPSFTLPEVDRPEFTLPTSPTTTEYLPEYIPEWVPPSTTPRPDYSPLTWDPVGEHVQKWKQKISSYAAADSRTLSNVAPMISQVFNYDYANKFKEAIRRIPKKIHDVGSKLKNSVFEDQTRAVLREEISVIERKGARGSTFEDQLSFYNPSEESAIQKSSNRTQPFTTVTKRTQNADLLGVPMARIGDGRSADDDDHIKKITPRKKKRFSRFLRMLARTVTMPKREWRQYQTVTMTLATAKEFLRQKADTHSYFEMIETLQEGYMMVFLIELTRLIATKERAVVRDVVKHSKQIIFSAYQSRQLQWFGTPLIDVTTKVARLLKDLKIYVIQNHAAYLHHMLIQRHQALSVEVNTILEYADMLYDDDEGRLLFDALKQFAAYPNISLTGYWLCDTLLNNFLGPYRRLKDTQQRQELLDSVNLVLKKRLSSNGLNEEPPLRYGDVKQANAPPDETEVFPPNELVAQTEPRSDTTRATRERKRKRHFLSLKRKREKTNHRYRPYLN